jgi:hypothetical protein
VISDLSEGHFEFGGRPLRPTKFSPCPKFSRFSDKSRNDVLFSDFGIFVRKTSMLRTIRKNRFGDMVAAEFST